MGALDDAIREHLELKRKQGASEEELKHEEDEALGRGGMPPEAPPAPAEPVGDEDLEVFDAAENGFGPGEPTTPEPGELDAEVSGAGPAPAVAEPEASEPDEVLPEEALELEPSALPDPLPNEDAAEPPNDAGTSLDEADARDDLLEETPEFLEDAPGQDRLWFEQGAPKDFDFDD